MIGQAVTAKDGKPVDGNGNMLAESAYQPSGEVMKLFSRCQTDYNMAWNLQHRPFREFDGYSLLERTRLDQETFGAYVGAEYVPKQKQWRWRGRKSTTRNRLLSIAAQLLSAMLFPYVYATNNENEEDKMTARVARILIEDHLKKAGYEIKFLYMLVSALVNPCVWVKVEYVIAFQKIKQKMNDGTYKITDAIDEFLSGLVLGINTIDEILALDFYQGCGSNIQRQPGMIQVERITYDEAKKRYAGKKYVMGPDGMPKDLFDYVQAGQTRIVMAGQSHEVLYDIEWTEADANCVQILTFFYRGEDAEFPFVAGVFFGNEQDMYNSNPFTHRRMSLIGNDYVTVPIYPWAQSGFEPIDPTGRFLYYKSGAFKAYWDDASQNRAHQILHDGTYLDVIKPIVISGIAKADSTVILPGATIALPTGATMNSWSMSPNIAAAFQLLTTEKEDISESTNDESQSGAAPTPGVTAQAAQQAQQNAQIFLGLFGIMIADLVKQVGELALDEIVAHTTVGELDATVPEALRMKYQTVMARGKDKGKSITNKIVFTDSLIGKQMTQSQIKKLEWGLWKQAGGDKNKVGNIPDARIYMVNPYKFARTGFGVAMDAQEIVSYAAGTKQQKDIAAYTMLTQPSVIPYTDQEAVIEDFVIDQYGGNDPDRYKRKGNAKNQSPMLSAIMGGGNGQPSSMQPGAVGTGNGLPVTTQ